MTQSNYIFIIGQLAIRNHKRQNRCLFCPVGLSVLKSDVRKIHNIMCFTWLFDKQYLLFLIIHRICYTKTLSSIQGKSFKGPREFGFVKEGRITLAISPKISRLTRSSHRTWAQHSILPIKRHETLPSQKHHQLSPHKMILEGYGFQAPWIMKAGINLKWVRTFPITGHWRTVTERILTVRAELISED